MLWIRTHKWSALWAVQPLTQTSCIPCCPWACIDGALRRIVVALMSHLGRICLGHLTACCAGLLPRQNKVPGPLCISILSSYTLLFHETGWVQLMHQPTLLLSPRMLSSSISSKLLHLVSSLHRPQKVPPPRLLPLTLSYCPSPSTLSRETPDPMLTSR